MQPIIIQMVIMLHAAFGCMFLLLYRQYPSKFSRLLAMGWILEAVRAGIILAQVPAVTNWSYHWYVLSDCLEVVAAWWLLAACADLMEVRLPTWLGRYYVGISVLLILGLRYPVTWLLTAWLHVPPDQSEFGTRFAVALVVFLPLTVMRAAILNWLVRLWRKSRPPGALWAIIFAVPYVVLALINPIQVFFSYYPDWLFFLWAIRVLGFSLGLVTLVFDKLLLARREGEVMMRENELRFHAVFAQSPLAIVLTTLSEGRVTDANQAAEKLLGYKLSEVRGLTTTDMKIWVTPADRDRYLQMLQSNSGVSGYEARLRVKGGAELDVLFHGRVVHIGGLTYVLNSLLDITERKKVATALQHEQSLVNTLFSTIPDYVYTKDRESRFRSINLIMARRFGLTDTQGAIGKTDADFYSEEHAGEAFVHEQMMMKTGEPLINLEERETWPDGRVTWVSTNKVPLRDRAGQIIGLIGISRDITDRKQVEDALRFRTAFFEAQVDSALDGILVVDSSGRKILQNRRMAEVWKIPPEVVEDKDDARQVRFVTARTKNPQQFVEKVVHLYSHPAEISRDIIELVDGTILDRYSAPVSDKEGKYYGRIWTFRDVTENRKAEELVRHLAAFPELNPNPVLEFNRDGTLAYQNPAAVSMAKKVGHAGIEQLLPAGTAAIVTTCLASGQPRLRLETAPGQSKLSWSFYPITGQQVVHCYVGDITDRQSLEEQLRQAQKMEAIGQLAGGVAHDFNNMLTAIIGHLGLLRENPKVTNEIDESLSEISAAANRAAKLTSQLLAFSRRQVLSTSALDLNEVVTHLTKMLRRILGEHVIMQLDFAPEPLTFQGDAGLMEQVLVNLAVNARDAMPEGGTLKITTRSVTHRPPSTNEQRGPQQSAPYVRLSVGDTGIGILPEIRAKIFEPFFTTKEVGKGTGLGLATVFGIVQQHNGWIEVESEPGHGATFHIYLPRLAVDPAVVPVPQPVFVPRGRNELVLLVEDEPAVQEMGMQALRRQGYRVVSASNGRAALEVWAQHKDEIALLLTDMIMPEGISGQQLARQLLEEKPALKVIYSSGYNAEIAGKELKLTDGVNYLAKPYELERLYRTVRAALDGTRSPSRPPFGEG